MDTSDNIIAKKQEWIAALLRAASSPEDIDMAVMRQLHIATTRQHPNNGFVNVSQMAGELETIIRQLRTTYNNLIYDNIDLIPERWAAFDINLFN